MSTLIFSKRTHMVFPVSVTVMMWEAWMRSYECGLHDGSQASFFYFIETRMREFYARGWFKHIGMLYLDERDIRDGVFATSSDRVPIQYLPLTEYPCW